MTVVGFNSEGRCTRTRCRIAACDWCGGWHAGCVRAAAGSSSRVFGRARARTEQELLVPAVHVGLAPHLGHAHAVRVVWVARLHVEVTIVVGPHAEAPIVHALVALRARVNTRAENKVLWLVTFPECNRSCLRVPG